MTKRGLASKDQPPPALLAQREARRRRLNAFRD
jgi:hypothetical protein